MNCENNFCIYWSEGKCILENISLDASGRCEDCILVNIDESLLALLRKKLLDKYEEDL